MSQSDIAITWLISAFASLVIIVGKLGLALFGLTVTPPVDPAEAANWRLKRRWLAYSEFSALPAFATVATSATVYWHLPLIITVVISMALGALGFGFLLNALLYLAKKKAADLGVDESK